MDSFDQQGQQNKYEQGHYRDTIEANEILRESIRQMIMVSTIFMTGSFFVFQITDKTNVANNFWLIVVSWSLLIISMVCGIWQLILDSNYFIKLAKSKNEVARRIVDENITNYKDLNSVSEKEQKGLLAESKQHPFYLQIISLSIGLVTLFILVIKLII